MPELVFYRRGEEVLRVGGVFVAEEGKVRFEELGPPTQAEVERLLSRVRQRVLRLLETRGALPAQGPEDALQAYQSHSLQRDQEESNGAQRHIIAVQGTRAWARVLDYYMTRPIEAGEGKNIVYETHVYNTADSFERMFVQPSKSLPVIIGELGPHSGAATMSMEDTQTLMNRADELSVPYLAWSFHMRCPPSLLEDLSGGSCGIDMPLQPSEWGRQLKAHLEKKNAGL